MYELGPATEEWVNRMRARPAWKASNARMREEEDSQKPEELREAERKKKAEERAKRVNL